MEPIIPDFTDKKSRSTMKRRRHAPFQPLLLEPPPPPPPPQEPPAPPKTTRPWSKLPLPFVKHLLRRLQIPDYIRFSSVCHAWHISKKRAQTPPSPQLPWLLLPRHVRRPSLTFYSLSEDCLYRIPTPYVTGSECISAFGGWLLFEPNTPAMSAIPSRFIFNPLSSALHRLPNNPPPPPIIIATAIIDSPSPADPLDFLVVFASATSIYGWKPKSKDKFKKDNELGYFMVCMAAGGEKLYFITDELDLIEYHPGSDATNVLIPGPPPNVLPTPSSWENDHFLMVARVGDEMKILMAVVVYDLDVTGVDWVELYTECGGEWVRVEAAEFGDPVLFLVHKASSFCFTAMEAGGRGNRAYVVPERDKAESISKGQGLMGLMWVEIDLVTCGVTYKENKMRRSAKKPRIRSRLFFRKPKPPQPQVPPPTTRPWSKLPLLFVRHLLRRLQVPDYIRFSSVCHAWHISKKRAQTPPAPQLPWLILPRQTHESIITYYSLSEDCKYRLSLPSIYGYDCIASIKGWLLFESVTVHTLRFLANPLSAERYVLPNLPDSDFTLPKVTAAAISIPSSPSEGGTRILIACGNVIVVWDLFSKVQTKTQLNFNVLDMVATANNVYIVMANLELVRNDPRTNEVTNIVQLDVPQGELPWPSSEKDHFLVVTEDWDVLMVVVVYCVGADDKATGVDRLELYVPCDGVWVRMPPEVFGDLVLFLGFGGSSIGISDEKAGGRARTAYVVPKRERAKSLSNVRRVDLKWVEINLESGEVSYK